jgi:3D (Asp-Asp-Asp) domain-containing protein
MAIQFDHRWTSQRTLANDGGLGGAGRDRWTEGLERGARERTAPAANLDARGASALGAWGGQDGFARVADATRAGAAATDAPRGDTYRARGTGYYPHDSKLEGGFQDRSGRPLHTLQDYLAGKAPYVSVAMDKSAFPYGTKLRIPELEAKYGRAIDFRVVDTGGAFKGRGTSRIDICTENRAASLDPTINGPLTLIRPRD